MIGLDWHDDPSNDILPELVGHSDSQYMVYVTWLSASGVKWVTVCLMSWMIYRLLWMSLVSSVSIKVALGNTELC